MRKTFGVMVATAFLLFGCGAEQVLDGSGGMLPGGGAGGTLPGGGSGGGDAEAALSWSWESQRLDPYFVHFACNDDGTCVGLVVHDDEIQLVDLESGASTSWSKDREMEGDLRFGKVEWIGDRFVVVGGVGYKGVVLEQTAEGLELVFRSDRDGACVGEEFACLLSSPLAAVTLAGGDLYALHPDGKLVRGSEGGSRWEVLPTGAASLFISLAAGADGALFAAALDGLHRLDGAAWTRVQEAQGLEHLWGDGAGFFAGAGGNRLHVGEGDFATVEIEGALFTDVWGASRRAVLAITSDGRAMRFDGQSWQAVDLPGAAGSYLTAISGSRNGSVVVLSADGLVIRGTPVEG